jgi:hypothetical protein
MKVMAVSKQPWLYEDMLPSRQVRISETGEHVVTVTHVVHTIKMSDCDDPDLLVAEPIYNWQQTDMGKWVMENSLPKASWHRHADFNTYGYIYQIRAYLTPQQITYFELKFK